MKKVAGPRSPLAYQELLFLQGFFLAVSPESLMSIAKHALENNHILALNVSAPFVMEFYKKPLEDVLPYVDILFGNELVSYIDFYSINYGAEIKKNKVAVGKLSGASESYLQIYPNKKEQTRN